jgi:hypothetical protein
VGFAPLLKKTKDVAASDANFQGTGVEGKGSILNRIKKWATKMCAGLKWLKAETNGVFPGDTDQHLGSLITRTILMEDFVLCSEFVEHTNCILRTVH